MPGTLDHPPWLSWQSRLALGSAWQGQPASWIVNYPRRSFARLPPQVSNRPSTRRSCRVTNGTFAFSTNFKIRPSRLRSSIAVGTRSSRSPTSLRNSRQASSTALHSGMNSPADRCSACLSSRETTSSTCNASRSIALCSAPCRVSPGYFLRLILGSLPSLVGSQLFRRLTCVASF